MLHILTVLRPGARYDLYGTTVLINTEVQVIIINNKVKYNL